VPLRVVTVVVSRVRVSSRDRVSFSIFTVYWATSQPCFSPYPAGGAYSQVHKCKLWELCVMGKNNSICVQCCQLGSSVVRENLGHNNCKSCIVMFKTTIFFRCSENFPENFQRNIFQDNLHHCVVPSLTGFLFRFGWLTNANNNSFLTIN